MKTKQELIKQLTEIAKIDGFILKDSNSEEGIWFYNEEDIVVFELRNGTAIELESVNINILLEYSELCEKQLNK